MCCGLITLDRWSEGIYFPFHASRYTFIPHCTSRSSVPDCLLCTIGTCELFPSQYLGQDGRSTLLHHHHHHHDIHCSHTAFPGLSPLHYFHPTTFHHSLYYHTTPPPRTITSPQLPHIPSNTARTTTGSITTPTFPL